jgi:hypothetical protein
LLPTLLGQKEKCCFAARQNWTKQNLEIRFAQPLADGGKFFFKEDLFQKKQKNFYFT